MKQQSQPHQSQQQQDEAKKGDFDGVPSAGLEKKVSTACSLNSIDETDDEGISDISTHETIINPSDSNKK